MQPHTINRPHRKHKRLWLTAILLFVIAQVSHAQDAAWNLVFQPTFMRPDFALPIAGTKETVLTPALIKGEDVTLLTKADAARLKLDLASVRRVAAVSASAVLATLKPTYVRDKKGVILYAVLASDSPATASAVLAPDFADKFADTFGPDILVAIPTRYRIYVYPALASQFQDTADLVLSDYEVSGYPVSKEVFRIVPGGVQAVGQFNER